MSQQNDEQPASSRRELLDSEFVEILESTGEGILVVDRNGGITHSNRRFAEMWGIPQKLLDERNDRKLLDFAIGQLAEPELFLRRVEELYDTLDEDFDHVRFTDGRVFERTSRPLVINGELSGRVWAFRDVSYQKRAEAALVANELRFRNLFNKSNDAIFIHDTRGNILDVNEQALRLLGYRRDEILLMNVAAFYPEEEVERGRAAISQIGVEGQIHYEIAFTRKNGDVFTAEVSASMFESGTQPLIQAIVRDITMRLKSESLQRALYRISEATNSVMSIGELVQHIREILWNIIDTTNFYIALYDAERDVYSFPYLADEKFVDKDPPTDLRGGLTDYVRRKAIPVLANNETLIQLELQGDARAVGIPSKVWLGVPLKSSHGVIGVVAVQDYEDESAFTSEDLDLLAFVSDQIAMAIERKQSEEQLRREKAYLEQLFESSPEAIVVLDTDGQITSVNSEFTRLFGFLPEDAIGRSIDDLIAPETDRDYARSITHKVQSGERVSLEAIRRRCDGSDVEVSILAIPIIIEGGQEGVYGVYRDITERKQAEQQEAELQERLTRAEKMESLGVLAGGVAHDLNNMLGPLVGYSDLLLLRLPEDSPYRRQIEKIGRSAKDAADVIQDLLTLARRGRYEMEPLSLNSVVMNYLESPACTNLQQVKPEISLDIHLDDDIPNIHGSAPHLAKVVMNLIVNAYDAISGPGEINVTTERTPYDSLPSEQVDIAPGEYICLRVADSGSGISEEDLERIFEPYYSKKKLGTSGSGLGLSVVYGIVKDHCGYYDIASEVGRGTEFRLYFPTTKERISEDDEQGDIASRGETVLIVDDSPDQREMAVTILETLGYRVESVPCGEDAIELLKNKSYDLLLLDMIMENGLDGLDTYREIVKFRPGQKAIVVSGYSQTERVQELLSLGAGRFVRKPYTIAGIGRAIREELFQTDTSEQSKTEEPSQ